MRLMIYSVNSNACTHTSTFLKCIAPHCFCHASCRLKAMVEVPHRPTMQEFQARRKSSITEARLSVRLGMCLPIVGDSHTISIERNNTLTRTAMSDAAGET